MTSHAKHHAKSGPVIKPEVARTTIIAEALNRLGLYSPQAERLLMGTAAVESNFSEFVQRGGGPARGMFQMEPPTFHDLLDRVLAAPKRHESEKHQALRTAVDALATGGTPSFSELTTNHLLAAAMARVKYYTIHAPIPTTLAGQANYWWVYYNGKSPHGIGVPGYLAAWNSYCAPIYGPGG